MIRRFHYRRLYEETKERLKKYEPKVVFIREFSNVAVHRFADASLDWIYIDARHDYDGVLEDMRLYWPKLRPGLLLLLCGASGSGTLEKLSCECRICP